MVEITAMKKCRRAWGKSSIGPLIVYCSIPLRVTPGISQVRKDFLDRAIDDGARFNCDHGDSPFHTKLQTNGQSWRGVWGTRQVRPRAVTHHDGPWPAAPSMQELAASRQIRRSCRGHPDRHLDQALALAASFSVNLYSSHPGCRLLCCSRSTRPQ